MEPLSEVTPESSATSTPKDSPSTQEKVLSAGFYIGKKDLIIKRLQMACITLHDVEKYDMIHNLKDRFDGFAEELEGFKSKLEELQRSVKDAIEENDSPSLYSLETPVNEFVTSLCPSEEFYQH